MDQPVINRIAQSALTTIDLEEYLDLAEPAYFDLKPALHQGMVLKESEFRTYVKDHDWDQYKGRNVAVYCSAEAIIPSWAYMLVATRLVPVAKTVVIGGEDDLEKALIDEAIAALMRDDFAEAKVVIKGCGKIRNRDYAYFQLAKRLIPVVSSLMYGEPCSTVPVFKKKK